MDRASNKILQNLYRNTCKAPPHTEATITNAELQMILAELIFLLGAVEYVDNRLEDMEVDFPGRVR